MKATAFLLSVIVLSIASLNANVWAVSDTCEVYSVDNVVPYSHVQVGVRVFTDSPDWIAGVVIPLTWNSTTSSITCDSIHWSDWFWANPATEYSGEEGGPLEDYIDSSYQELTIVAIWFGPPYLPPSDTILATIHFTAGKIDITHPGAGEACHVGYSKWIGWSAECDWNVNDSVVIDTFRLPNQQDPFLEPVNFSDTLGNHIGFYYFGERIEFKRGYLTKSSQSGDSVRIEYSFDAGRTWNTVASSTPNDGYYLWSPVPDTPSDSCLIRICSTAENPLCAVSESLFTIRFRYGDVNDDKEIGLSDVVYLINYLLRSGPPPIPDLQTGDMNCDNNVDLIDAVYLINYLFRGGPAPGDPDDDGIPDC